VRDDELPGPHEARIAVAIEELETRVLARHERFPPMARGGRRRAGDREQRRHDVACDTGVVAPAAPTAVRQPQYERHAISSL
jgi:hypothetical protein